MSNDHVDAFVRECNEQIVELNNALLTLESDPSDEEAIDLIFRTAHTLKGNFGAMGFEDTSTLAHAIEDLLEEIRADRLTVTPEIMDLVFEGVDHIEAAVESIADGEDPSIDTEETVTQLRAVLEADEESTTSGDEGESTTSGGSQELPDGVDLSAVNDTPAPIVHARVDVGDSEMPGVDGIFVLDSITETLTVADTVPSPESIRDGDFDQSFDLVLSGAADDRVDDVLGNLNRLESYDVQDISSALGDAETGSEAESGEAAGSGADSSEAVSDGDAETRDDGDPENSDDSTGTSQGDRASTGDADDLSADEIKSVRIDVGQLDELYGFVQQLVKTRIKLRRSVVDGDLDGTSDNLDELDKTSSRLQSTVMDMRLIPLENVVNTFPRMVRDLAREQDKSIDFDMVGTDVELDRTILDEIADPLMHILRNAVDHGIEAPEERESNGKPPEGTVRLRARRERDHVEIDVEDDGGGLDVERITSKAIEEGLYTSEELEAMPESDVYDLIFHPGFSTAETVSDVSGRGVGMDVVSETVRQLDGSVSVASTPGEGTTVTLRLPVSVAIIKVLLIEVGEKLFGVPIKAIDEISKSDEVHRVVDEEAIDHAGETYSVVDLAETIDAVDATTTKERDTLLRIREEERPVALRCDEVDRLEEVVVKPLDGSLTDVSGVSGTAVIGDGNVVPIIDVKTI